MKSFEAISIEKYTYKPDTRKGLIISHKDQHKRGECCSGFLLPKSVADQGFLKSFNWFPSKRINLIILLSEKAETAWVSLWGKNLCLFNCQRNSLEKG